MQVESVSKISCRSEEAFSATEESRIFGAETLRAAQGNIFEIACSNHQNTSLKTMMRGVFRANNLLTALAWTLAQSPNWDKPPEATAGSASPIFGNRPRIYTNKRMRAASRTISTGLSSNIGSIFIAL